VKQINIDALPQISVIPQTRLSSHFLKEFSTSQQKLIDEMKIIRKKKEEENEEIKQNQLKQQIIAAAE